MKPSLTALIVLNLLTPLVSAQDGPPAGTDSDKQWSQMQKDMNSMLQQIAKLRQQSQLQENLHTMQSQLDRLQRASDPDKRQKLIQEHLDTLQEHMKMIESMRQAEKGSGGQKPTAQLTPASPGRMIYGPVPMGFPRAMMYGPGTTGGPQGYPGVPAAPRYR